MNGISTGLRVVSVAGDRVAILLSGEDTQGQYAVMEATVPPGAGPPPHLHHREDETFLVLAGEITFYRGEETIVMKPGGFVFGPRGIRHYFRNTGSKDAVLLETASPAGVERFFEQAGHPLASREERPLPMTPEDIQRLRALAPEYGIDILGPPSRSAG